MAHRRIMPTRRECEWQRQRLAANGALAVGRPMTPRGRGSEPEGSFTSAECERDRDAGKCAWLIGLGSDVYNTWLAVCSSPHQLLRGHRRGSGVGGVQDDHFDVHVARRERKHAAELPPAQHAHRGGAGEAPVAAESARWMTRV